MNTKIILLLYVVSFNHNELISNTEKKCDSKQLINCTQDRLMPHSGGIRSQNASGERYIVLLPNSLTLKRLGHFFSERTFIF